MGLTINANGFADRLEVSERGAGDAADKGRRAVFAGGLNQGNDPIAQRRKEAREQAWNVVKNAWNNDKSMDELVQSRREEYARLGQQKKEASQTLGNIEDCQAALRETGDTSEEAGARARELSRQAAELKKQIADYDQRRKDEKSNIDRIGLERLKSNPMVGARNAADEILGAANDEIIGMAMQEAQEHIEEELEKAGEKAEKATEEKEEREEQLDEQKLARAVQEAMIEGTKEAIERAKAIERQNEAAHIQVQDMIDIAKGDGDITKDVGASLDDIKYSMKVLEADLKGIKVDEEV